jgi:hypothetical protein
MFTCIVIFILSFAYDSRLQLKLKEIIIYKQADTLPTNCNITPTPFFPQPLTHYTLYLNVHILFCCSWILTSGRKYSTQARNVFKTQSTRLAIKQCNTQITTAHWTRLNTPSGRFIKLQYVTRAREEKIYNLSRLTIWQQVTTSPALSTPYLVLPGGHRLHTLPQSPTSPVLHPGPQS